MAPNSTEKGEDRAIGKASDAPKRPPSGIGTGLAGLFAGMSHEMATAVFPVFLALLGGGAALLGAIEGLAAAGSSFVRLGIGHYGGRIGRRKPMILLGCAMTAAMGMFAFAASPFHLLPLRLFGWMGRGVRESAQDAPAADGIPPSHDGGAFGFHRAPAMIGGVVGPLIALSLVSLFTIRQIFLVSLVPALLAVAAVVLLVPERPIKRLDPLRSPLRDRLPSSFRLFLAGAGAFGLGNVAHTLLIFRAYEMLTRDHGPARAAVFAVLLYALRNVFYAASYPAGRRSGRIGKRRLLGLGYFLFASVSAGFIFVPPVKSYIGWLPALLLLILLLVLAGISIALVESTEGATAAELLPEPLRESGHRMLGLVKGAGRFASSIAVGLVWSLVSPTAGFLYAAFMALLGAALLYRVPR